MELKELKGYLGTGAKFVLTQTGIFNMDCEGQVPHEAYEPLDLANLVISSKGYEVELIHKNGWGIGFIEPNEFTLALHPMSDLNKHKVCENFTAKEILIQKYPGESLGLNPATWSHRVIEKLYEWHFDIYGLIKKGEAIDINTLNKQDGASD